MSHNTDLFKVWGLLRRGLRRWKGFLCVCACVRMQVHTRICIYMCVYPMHVDAKYRKQTSVAAPVVTPFSGEASAAAVA